MNEILLELKDIHINDVFYDKYGGLFVVDKIRKNDHIEISYLHHNLKKVEIGLLGGLYDISVFNYTDAFYVCRLDREIPAEQLSLFDEEENEEDEEDEFEDD